jgi:signal transduction histidine kinase
MRERGPRAGATARGLHRNVFLGALALGIISIAFVIGLMAAQSFDERKARIEYEKDALSRMAQLVAVQFSEMLDNLKFFFKAADLWLSAHPGADPRFDRDFARLVEDFRASSRGAFEIRLASRSGGLYAVPSASTEPLTDVRDRSYFTAQLSPATRGFFLAEPVVSRVTMTWGIPISYPLASGNGGMSLILATLELPTVEELFERVRPKPGGSISLIRRDGRFLTRIPFDEAYLATSISGDPASWWIGISNTDVIVMRAATTDKAERIIAARTILDPDIAVSISARMDDVLASWRASLTWRIALALGLIAVICVFSTWLLIAMRKADAAQRELAESVANLRESDATKDKLFSILAHDLRGPIGGICNLLDTMAQDIGQISREDLEQYLSALRVGSWNTYQLLENILAWSRSKRGDMPFRPVMIRVLPVIKECAEVYALAAESKRISLEIDVDPALEARADPDLLKVVARNLISNAVKFSRQGGAVRVAALAEAGGTRLTVSDQGIGMDARTRAEIFSRGGAGSRAGTASEGGSGLGLVLCRDIVEMHGGIIEAESSEGAGSAIAVFLPDQGPGPGSASAASAASSSRLSASSPTGF